MKTILCLIPVLTLFASAKGQCDASFTASINHGQVRFSVVTANNQVNLSQSWSIYRSDSSLYATISETDPSYNFTDTGDYYVCLHYFNYDNTTFTTCSSVYCDIIHISDVSGRYSFIASYPNPVGTEPEVRLKINLANAGVIQYKLYDIVGNIRLQAQRPGQPGQNIIVIPVSRLNAGQYFVELIYDKQKKQSVFQKFY